MPRTKKVTEPTEPVKRTRKVASPVMNQNEYSRQPALQSSQLLITALVAVLAFATGYLVSQVKTLSSGKVLSANQQAQPSQTAQQQADVKVSMDQVRKLVSSQKLTFGDKNSKLTFVEFSDPSCPYCHVAGGKNPELANQANFKYKDQGGTYIPPVAEMKKLLDAGKASFTMVYTNGHGNGIIGAQALYCANEKGKFWEAHDLLLSNNGYNLLNNDVKNDKANDQKIVDFLADAVDPTFMKDCLDTEKYKDQLTKDESEARTFGVSGTPHFLVNNTPYKGAYSYSDMESTVKTALEK